jgi:hypothetical protein
MCCDGVMELELEEGRAGGGVELQQGTSGCDVFFFCLLSCLETSTGI